MTCRPNDVTGVCNCENCRIPDDECGCGRELDENGLCPRCDEAEIYGSAEDDDEGWVEQEFGDPA